MKCQWKKYKGYTFDFIYHCILVQFNFSVYFFQYSQSSVQNADENLQFDQAILTESLLETAEIILAEEETQRYHCYYNYYHYYCCCHSCCCCYFYIVLFVLVHKNHNTSFVCHAASHELDIKLPINQIKTEINLIKLKSVSLIFLFFTCLLDLKNTILFC